jgi:flavin-dependent dehydrogenase
VQTGVSDRQHLADVSLEVIGAGVAAVDLVPDVAQRVRNGHREERFYGATNLPNFLRKPIGPGWALVGDAGCHKDPYMALGLGDAFRDANLLAEALDDGLSGQRPLEEALADYEQRRNAATRADNELNLTLAQSRRSRAKRSDCAGCLTRQPGGDESVRHGNRGG